VLLPQRQLSHLATREGGATIGHRISRLGRQHDVPLGVAVDEDLRQQEDRFLRPVRRDDLRVGIDGNAEAVFAPTCDRLAQLGQTLGERVPHPLSQARDERGANRRIGRLHRVALAEVDQLHALSRQAPLGLLELDERIRAGGAQRGRDLHRLHNAES